MKYIESVSIGFDIGVGSVGYAVINSKTKQILESGVSIFPAAVAQKNVERREFRQSRRLIRRRVNRLNDLKKLLKKNGFIPSPNKNPYEIRVRGLEHQLNKDEIAIAMLHIAKRRGISYSLDDVVDDNVTDFKGKIAKNQEALKNKTPGEIQYERLLKYGKVRGTVTNYVEYDEQPEYFLNVFPNSAYVDEAKRILTCQKQYYPEITDVLIENIVKIISRKRAYYIGPGNENSRTDYGIYRTNGETLENIFEILIGKDSVNPDELRAPANSLTAQVYNLLNDLTNIRYNGSERLTPEQKQDILSELLTTEKTVQMLN
ncbi:type II CRISPR RNA-guided endonuclease Cas9, partial [Enterococcus cecorum]